MKQMVQQTSKTSKILITAYLILYVCLLGYFFFVMQQINFSWAVFCTIACTYWSILCFYPGLFYRYKLTKHSNNVFSEAKVVVDADYLTIQFSEGRMVFDQTRMDRFAFGKTKEDYLFFLVPFELLMNIQKNHFFRPLKCSFLSRFFSRNRFRQKKFCVSAQYMRTHWKDTVFDRRYRVMRGILLIGFLGINELLYFLRLISNTSDTRFLTFVMLGGCFLGTYMGQRGFLLRISTFKAGLDLPEIQGEDYLYRFEGVKVFLDREAVQLLYDDEYQVLETRFKGQQYFRKVDWGNYERWKKDLNQLSKPQKIGDQEASSVESGEATGGKDKRQQAESFPKEETLSISLEPSFKKKLAHFFACSTKENRLVYLFLFFFSVFFSLLFVPLLPRATSTWRLFFHFFLFLDSFLTLGSLYTHKVVTTDYTKEKIYRAAYFDSSKGLLRLPIADGLITIETADLPRYIVKKTPTEYRLFLPSFGWYFSIPKKLLPEKRKRLRVASATFFRWSERPSTLYVWHRLKKKTFIALFLLLKVVVIFSFFGGNTLLSPPKTQVLLYVPYLFIVFSVLFAILPVRFFLCGSWLRRRGLGIPTIQNEYYCYLWEGAQVFLKREAVPIHYDVEHRMLETRFKGQQYFQIVERKAYRLFQEELQAIDDRSE